MMKLKFKIVFFVLLPGLMISCKDNNKEISEPTAEKSVNQVSTQIETVKNNNLSNTVEKSRHSYDEKEEEYDDEKLEKMEEYEKKE
jgi:hypothetical protein